MGVEDWKMAIETMKQEETERKKIEKEKLHRAEIKEVERRKPAEEQERKLAAFLRSEEWEIAKEMMHCATKIKKMRCSSRVNAMLASEANFHLICDYYIHSRIRWSPADIGVIVEYFVRNHPNKNIVEYICEGLDRIARKYN